MKSVFYSLIVVFSLSLVSCEKQDFNEREGLNNYQSLDKKEGEDEDDHTVVQTVLNSSNVPVSNAVIHTLLSSTSQCVSIGTTDANGMCTTLIATDNYFFQVYENGILVYTSSNYDIDSDVTLVHKLP